MQYNKKVLMSFSLYVTIMSYFLMRERDILFYLLTDTVLGTHKS